MTNEASTACCWAVNILGVSWLAGADKLVFWAFHDSREAGVSTGPLRLSANILKRDALECHMRHTAFIKDADRLPVDHRKARIPPAFALVKKQLMLEWPGLSTVEADLDRHLVARGG